MSKPISLKIPKQHLDILIYFFSLPRETKEQFYLGIGKYSGELNPKDLVEYFSNITNLEKKKLFDISIVFLTLIHSINSYEGTSDEFVSQIGESLVETYPEVKFDEEKFTDVKRFLENGSSATLKAKVIELITENTRNYSESKIFQDLRTSFDNNGNVIASGIIHNLKISTYEGRKKKDYYISMDNKDLEALAKEIKRAQENVKNINLAFNNGNILDI